MAKKQGAIREGRAESLITACFVFLFGVAAAVAVQAYWAFEKDHSFAQVQKLEKATQELFALMQEAELGQRDYILTRERAYLEPYRLVLSNASPILERLRRLASAKGQQEGRLNWIQQMIAKQVIAAKRSVELADQNKHGEAFAAVRLDESKLLGKTLHDSLSSFIDAENDQASQRNARISTVQTAVFAFTGFCLFATYILIARSSRSYADRLGEEVKLRRKLQRALGSYQHAAPGQLVDSNQEFGNQLSSILGHLDRAFERLEKTDADLSRNSAPEAPRMKAIGSSGRNVRHQMQRLPAPSRQQPLDPKVINLNEMIRSIADLVRRGFHDAVDLQIVLANDLWSTYIDANQFESAILNLLINARQTMPDGGLITIQTTNVFLDDVYATRFGGAPGLYACLSVSDTGPGISADIVEMILDPSRGDPGASSARELVRVHALVKQSGGHMRIYSEFGQGKTVKIFLLRAQTAGASLDKGRHLEAPRPPAHTRLAAPPIHKERLISYGASRR